MFFFSCLPSSLACSSRWCSCDQQNLRAFVYPKSFDLSIFLFPAQSPPWHPSLGEEGGEACKWQELVWYCTQPVFLQQCKARYCSDARAIVTMQMQCQYNVSDNISGKILSTSSVLAIPNTRVIPSVTKRLARFVRGLSTPCSKFEPPLLSCQRYFNPPG